MPRATAASRAHTRPAKSPRATKSIGSRRTATAYSDASDSDCSAYCPSDEDFVFDTPPTSPGYSGDACSYSASPSPPPTQSGTGASETIPRPPNCFILFRSSYHKEHRLAAHESGKHLSVKATEAWRTLPRDERAFWVGVADAKKAEHARRYPDYVFRPQTAARKKAGKKAADAARATKKAARPHRSHSRRTPAPTQSQTQSPSPLAIAAPLPVAAEASIYAHPELTLSPTPIAYAPTPEVSSNPPTPTPTFSLDGHLLVLPSPGTPSTAIAFDESFPMPENYAFLPSESMSYPTADYSYAMSTEYAYSLTMEHTYSTTDVFPPMNYVYPPADYAFPTMNFDFAAPSVPAPLEDNFYAWANAAVEQTLPEAPYGFMPQPVPFEPSMGWAAF